MSKERMCDVCGMHKATQKDYRFIESCGFQGGILACQWCAGLNDVAISDIVRNRETENAIDPLDEYDFPKPVEFTSTVTVSAFVGNAILATSRQQYIERLIDSFEDEFGLDITEEEISNIEVKEEK